MNSKDISNNPGNCIPPGMLERYALGSLSGDDLNMVMDHLKECSVCSRRFKILTGYFSGPGDSYSVRDLVCSTEVPGRIAETIRKKGKPAVKPFPPPEAPAPSQIWLVHPVGEETASPPLPVVLLPGSGDIDGECPAAVISWETGLAAERDLIVEEDESLIGIGFIIETWNPVRVASEQLCRCLGELSREQRKMLRKLLKSRPVEATGLNVGSALRSLDDARIYFQSLELKRARKIGESGPGEEDMEAVPEEAVRPYSLAGVSAAALLANLRSSFARAPVIADSATRSFFLGLKKFYRKYLIPVFPIAVGFAVPLIAHLFFRRLSKSMMKSKVPSPLKPETELLQGLSYCGLGRWKEALNVLSKVMAHPATLFAGLVFSAWILARMGKFKQAAESIRRAKELPRREQTFEIDFDRIERFIEDEREAEFKEWFDNTIGNYILKETARLISSL